MSRRMKVLQVNKLYYPTTGGIERVVQQIAEGLKDEVDMRVLVCREKGCGKKDKVNGVRVYRAGSLGRIFSLPVSLQFFLWFRKLSADQDIIQVHMPFPLADIACLTSGYKGKIVVWWHSDIVRQKKIMLFYRPLMERFLDRADVIIAATEGNIKNSLYLKPYRDKCMVIPFGTDESLFQEASRYIQEKKQITDSKRKKTSNSFTFLFVGRLVYYKGCDILIQSFAKVIREREKRNTKKNVQNVEQKDIGQTGSELKLVLVGGGPQEEELKNMAIQLGIEKNLVFLGEIPDDRLYRQYEECDALVLPSVQTSEAFGLVQIEAMSFGKPVINTNLASGVPYVGQDGVTGLTVKPGDIGELAQAMAWLSEHREVSEEMGTAARRLVEERYQMQKMLDNVKNLYDGLNNT